MLVCVCGGGRVWNAWPGAAAVRGEVRDRENSGTHFSQFCLRSVRARWVEDVCVCVWDVESREKTVIGIQTCGRERRTRV